VCICLTVASSALHSSDELAGTLPCQQQQHNTQTSLLPQRSGCCAAAADKAACLPTHRLNAVQQICLILREDIQYHHSNQHRHQVPFKGEQHAWSCRPVCSSTGSSHSRREEKKDKTALFSINLIRSPVLCRAAQASHSADLGQFLPCEYVYAQLSRSNRTQVRTQMWWDSNT